MAGQSSQHQCSSTSRHAEHPYTTHPKTPTLAWSCSPYRTRSLAKTSPLRGTVGGRPTMGRALLRFKDVCKHDLRLADLNPNTWEVLAQDRDAWRHGVKEGALRAETKARAEATIKRAARKERQDSDGGEGGKMDIMEGEINTIRRATLNNHIGQLEQKRQKLSQLDTEFTALIDKLDDLQQEILESEELQSTIVEEICRGKAFHNS
ncbi:hypothetical protein ACROYT_G022532 [Oculina patagonica]